MCGVAGFIDFDNKSTKEVLIKMTDSLILRGPDDSGYKFHEKKDYNIGLGHRRLSILDLSSQGHQPMIYEKISIVYNGEVYNFKELKEELIKLNYKFKSNTDTEVILKAYHKWGVDFVNKINGMFIITLYDENINKVFIFRDRAGVKPLYWYWKDDLFLFSSELKSFHKNENFQKKINFNSLGEFLQYGYIMEPNCIFDYTYKLKSGHYIEFDLAQKKIDIKKYWSIHELDSNPKRKLSKKEFLKELNDLLISSFKYRMISDVPVGVFLSGGYDSSILTAILQKYTNMKIKTYTIGFHEKGFDEAPYAREVAKHLKTEHTEYYCSQKEAFDIIPDLPLIYDEPFGDVSAIPTILVSKLAKKDVSVVLSADGGDEIFGGYKKYITTINTYKKIKSVPLFLRKSLNKILSKIDINKIPYFKNLSNIESKFDKVKELLMADDIIDVMKILSQPSSFNQVKKFLISEIKENKNNFSYINDKNIVKSDIDKLLNVDFDTYMKDDVLVKVDRATMSQSIEGREPLMDYRIIEFMASVDVNFKIHNGELKWALKELTHNLLPKEIMDRPKMGFGVPIMEWFRDDLKIYFDKYISKELLSKQNIFNIDEVISLKESYLRGNKENVNKLWYILMFQMWYEKWVDQSIEI